MASNLRGLALRNYRSIGPDIQKMAPFKKFNFFIGANNSGKSTVLDFIYKYLPLPGDQSRLSLSWKNIAPLDIYSGGLEGTISFSQGILVADFDERCLSALGPLMSQKHREAISRISSALAEEGLIWFRVELPHIGSLRFENNKYLELAGPALGQDVWQTLWNNVKRMSGGALHQNWIPDILAWCVNVQDFSLPKIQMIPAIRQIGPTGGDFTDFSGKGLIDRLAEIQSPDHDRLHDRELFKHINNFLQEVTSCPDARIEIPHNRAHILVHMNGKLLPITALGTGIHEVIMIAAFCTISENSIVCVEEPETHLHPVLQRKLVNYLNEETSNQYFVTTHSPAFIDTEDAALFHVTNDGRQAYIRESVLRKERFSICRDLGHRASEIMQSNAVIWVEGPSDRIYLQHWIAHLEPKAIEGIHYSIMFYGGRLLSHLSADDNDVREFIDLRSLNQHLAVVMDSDKKSASDIVNATKMRIAEAFTNEVGLAWITAGREIENYVNFDVLQETVRQNYLQIYVEPASSGTYGHSLHFKRFINSDAEADVARSKCVQKTVDKVKIAKAICGQPANLDVLDLRERVTAIVQLIKHANQ